MTQALEKVPHVDSANTDFKKKRSMVQANGDGCSIEGEIRLIQAVEELGYQAEVQSNKKK